MYVNIFNRKNENSYMYLVCGAVIAIQKFQNVLNCLVIYQIASLKA